MAEKELTYEEVVEICTKKCCGILREDAKNECTNPYWCIYELTADSGLE